MPTLFDQHGNPLLSVAPPAMMDDVPVVEDDAAAPEETCPVPEETCPVPEELATTPPEATGPRFVGPTFTFNRKMARRAKALNRRNPVRGK